jgi:hypothetical protein
MSEPLVYVCPWATTGAVHKDTPNVVIPAACVAEGWKNADDLVEHLLTAHGGRRGWRLESAEREADEQRQRWIAANSPPPEPEPPIDFTEVHYRVVRDIPGDGKSWDTYANREEAVKQFMLACADAVAHGEVLLDLRGVEDPVDGGVGVEASFVSGVTIDFDTCYCSGDECASE